MRNKYTRYRHIKNVIRIVHIHIYDSQSEILHPGNVININESFLSISVPLYLLPQYRTRTIITVTDLNV